MYTGHYASALLLKRAVPQVPLWQLFLAAQGLDLLFFALVPLGVERVSIDPTQSGNLALQLAYMPWSHSLLAAALLGGAVALAGRTRASVALGLAVSSHWLLDLPMHTPDLPLAAGDGPVFGWGLWTHPILAWAFEVGLLILSWFVHGTSNRRVTALVLVLLIIQTLNSFVIPLPTSTLALSLLSQGTYVAFALAARWAERLGPPHV